MSTATVNTNNFHNFGILIDENHNLWTHTMWVHNDGPLSVEFANKMLQSIDNYGYRARYEKLQELMKVTDEVAATFPLFVRLLEEGSLGEMKKGPTPGFGRIGMKVLEVKEIKKLTVSDVPDVLISQIKQKFEELNSNVGFKAGVPLKVLIETIRASLPDSHMGKKIDLAFANNLVTGLVINDKKVVVTTTFSASI